MRAAAVFVVACAFASPAHAGRCTANDAWVGPDKTKHFAVGVAMGSAGVLAFSDPRRAFILGASVGLAKELVDRGGRGTCSFQDFAVTALGAAAGAYGTAWIVTPTFIGYARRF